MDKTTKEWFGSDQGEIVEMINGSLDEIKRCGNFVPFKIEQNKDITDEEGTLGRSL